MSRSNSSYPTDQKMISVYQNGTFFNPASSHYVSTGNSNVVCDRCHKSELKSCIGYGELDICLSCARDIESSVTRFGSGTPEVTPAFSTNMMTNNLRLTTEMKTSRVKPTSPRASVTRMATSEF